MAERKTMDIARPGESTPDTTSRGIISKHSLTVDPMVKTAEQEQAEDTAVVNAVAEQTELSSKQKQIKQDDADIAKQEAIQKLINSKKYFVPICKSSKNKNNLLLFVVLLIAGLAAGGYYIWYN